ncbi:MAG TPA: potassium channel family protein [Coleofasciculaceae cyanobacterium]
MDWVAKIVGVGLVVLALVDLYLTVLYPRLSSGILSLPIGKGIWCLFRLAACSIPSKDKRLLSHAGAIVLIAIVVVWICLLIGGFALIVWPALGSAIQASQGQTPTDFGTALYYSGYSLTTLGVGDLVPKTHLYRLLTILEAALGFSVFTLTITYLLSVYSALIRRNSFALTLHHRTVGTVDAAELLARFGTGGNLSGIQQDISNMARDLMHLLEAQHSYPVLLYFRFSQNYYALPRMVYVSLDTATLIKSALNPEEYRSLVYSTAVTQLWGGTIQLLTEVSSAFLPKGRPNINEQQEQVWRQRYYHAVEKFRTEGIATVGDLEEGANLYIALRRKWQPDLAALSAYMAYEWSEVAPNER